MVILTIKWQKCQPDLQSESDTFFKNLRIRRHSGWLELLYSFWSFNFTTCSTWIIYYGMARSQTNYYFFLPLISTQDQMFNRSTTQNTCWCYSSPLLHIPQWKLASLHKLGTLISSLQNGSGSVFHFTSWVVDLSLGHLTTLLIS